VTLGLLFLGLFLALGPIPTASATSTMIDDTDGSVSYSAGWSADSDASSYLSTHHKTQTSGSTATVSITVASGTTATVTVVGITYPGLGGVHSLLLDGSYVGPVDSGGTSFLHQQDIGTTGTLSAGTYSVQVRADSSAFLWVDAFRVDSSPVATTTTSSSSSTTSTTAAPTTTTAAPTTTTTAPGGTTVVTYPESTDSAKQSVGALVLVLSLTCGLVAGKTLFR
jgi:hypothetical protein